MSAYGSSTGSEYLDEVDYPWDADEEDDACHWCGDMLCQGECLYNDEDSS